MTSVLDLQIILIRKAQTYAIPLLLHLERQALCYADTAKAMDEWLKTGSTILLRDTLAEPYRHDQWLVQACIDAGCKMENAWHECWTAIDAAMSNATTPIGQGDYLTRDGRFVVVYRVRENTAAGVLFDKRFGPDDGFPGTIGVWDARNGRKVSDFVTSPLDLICPAP